MNPVPTALRIALSSLPGILCVTLVATAPAPAQRTSAHTAESAPLPPPNPSTFDQNRLALGSQPAKSPEAIQEDACFLPPISGAHSSTVGVAALQVPAKAKRNYEDACAALKAKKVVDAEKNLRKAVQQYPKYPAAWVTLGQTLEVQQKTAEARDACSQALADYPNYLPAYLCLADIAGSTQHWDEMLKLSARAIELDPADDAVAYVYNAAANFNLHNLSEAEKNALKASEMDKGNREPRVHFLLAQIYEAKGDRDSEANQLREYLKFVNDPAESAMVKQYLAALPKKNSP
jgi:tetratricopeptide (TPR) repeat protein